MSGEDIRRITSRTAQCLIPNTMQCTLVYGSFLNIGKWQGMQILVLVVEKISVYPDSTRVLSSPTSTKISKILTVKYLHKYLGTKNYIVTSSIILNWLVGKGSAPERMQCRVYFYLLSAPFDVARGARLATCGSRHAACGARLAASAMSKQRRRR